MGVAGIEFRRVPCTHSPAKRAPDGPTGMPPSEQPSALGFPGTAFSPPSGTDVYEEKFVKRFDDAGEKQGKWK